MDQKLRKIIELRGIEDSDFAERSALQGPYGMALTGLSLSLLLEICRACLNNCSKVTEHMPFNGSDRQ